MIAGVVPLTRPLRFLIAGGLNTLFGLAFYPLLLWSVPYFHTHYMIALGLSQAVCLCFAFVTHKLAVFRTRGNALREFTVFSSFYLFNYAANWMALPLLVEFAGASPILAQLAFTAVLAVTSWFWHSRVTFRAAGDAA